MGKNLIQQARGKGGPRYRAPSHRYRGATRYPSLNENNVRGTVADLINCPGHSAPLCVVDYENGNSALMIAADAIKVGQDVEIGPGTAIKPGNITLLKNIPEGTYIYNIESAPGDGGKFVKASGTFARIVTKQKGDIIVLLPSKKKKAFRPECRATIGMVAGSGRCEKPFYKAGRRHHAMRARNKLYPLVSGTSMNAVDHPFGGSKSSKKGRSTTTSGNAPPGRKVGLLRARKTGKKR
ncbi:MAG: 50S ribosomal protein L2 [archaeon]